MSNSKLVDYTKISPNQSSRNGKKISKITIHHMASNLTVEQCGNVFSSSNAQASSNYGVGTDGRVGLYVDESKRSWCSSSRANDEVAITIEVANDGGAPEWHVSDKALNKTIELCVDICKRNGIEKINFTGDEHGNLTQHNYFKATACPGPYLKSKFDYIADKINEALGNGGSSEVVSNGNIAVDGSMGPATIKALQKHYGTTQDGIISNQAPSDKKATSNVYSVKYGKGGSDVVRAMQKDLGVKADGYLGVNTVKALQKKLGVKVDGSMGPDTVKALQKELNK